MRKKPEWTPCEGMVRCTACGSDEMEWMDVRVRSGVYKRETRCLGCGDRQTTPITAPELPAAPAAAVEETPKEAAERRAKERRAERRAQREAEGSPASKLAQAIAEGPGEPEVKTKLIGALEAAGAGDLTTAGRLASEAIEANDADAEPQQMHPNAHRTTTELLDLGAIHAESVQPRAQLDLLAAGDYARDMFVGPLGQVVNERGQEWPALIVYRELKQGKVWLADGFHRSKAATQAGMPAFQAEVRVGGKREALLHAVGANSRNGVRFTNVDKRRAVSLLFDDIVIGKKTDTEIAHVCGVSQPFVSKMRAERLARDQPAEQPHREDEEGREPRERSDNGYGEEGEPAPLQFDLVESIAARQRRQEEEEEEAAERRAEAERKRIEQEQRDSWSTPPEFLENIVRPILEWIDLDPASNEAAQRVVQAECWISAEEDGLAQEWRGRVWLNPPYSHPLVAQFAAKAIEEYESGRVEQLLVLTNSATGAAWWQTLACASSVIAFPSGRISFWSPHGLDGEQNRNSQTLFYFARPEQARAAVTHLRSAGYFATMHTTRLDS